MIEKWGWVSAKAQTEDDISGWTREQETLKIDSRPENAITNAHSFDFWQPSPNASFAIIERRW